MNFGFGYLIYILQDPLFEGIRIGLTKEESENCTQLKALSLNKIFRQSLLPNICGPGISLNLWNFMGVAFKCPKLLIKYLKRQSPVKGYWLTYNDLVKLATSEEIKKVEAPSATFHASARSLAKLAAMMANQGELLEENDEKNQESNPLMKKSTWNTMHTKTTRAFDAGHYGKNIFKTIYLKETLLWTKHDKIKMFSFFSEWKTNFSQGGVNIYSNENNNPTNGENNLNRDRQGFIGWQGMGGSIFQWHPELKIGFAFVPTSLHLYDPDCIRGAKLQKIVTDCVLKQQSIVGK